ncbi:hypothetical protein [Streptomyces sp. SM12]|uniref:hypothetical protein n=1 Tax=Streptomyces sp. SM12 TaxID=1071602 RepID=UPI000CD4C86B|nr:hypothetical protein [Streptomyces sp. SM12]
MSNPAKRKGTAFESAIVTFLREHHDPEAHRNVQMGAKDIGDIDGYYLHAVEAKAERTITLADYIRQANREAIHAGRPFGCAIVKARGKGIGASYVVRDLETDVRLVTRVQVMEEALKTTDIELWSALDEKYGGGGRG